jgi:hypothetical protein
MSDPKPGDEPSAAGTPDPDPADAGPETSTVDAPARWSGSAAVPPPGPKKSRFARRQARLQPDGGTAADDDEDWKDVTPVDPWAGLDTSWEAYPLAPESPMPPTRVEPPMPPTLPQWAPPAPTGAPSWTPPAQNGPPSWGPPTQNGPPSWAPQQQYGPPSSQQYGPPSSQQYGPQSWTPQQQYAPLWWTPQQQFGPPSWAPQAQSSPPTVPPWTLPAQNGLPPAPPPWTPQDAGPPPQAPPTKPPKKKRNKVRARPLPPAPPKAQRPLPPPPRRKRHWGRRLLLLSLLGVFCCCGLPLAYFQVPALRQYPVTAVLPKTFADLQRRDDDESKQAAERLADQLRGPNAGTKGVFTGVYGDDRGKQVTVFGVTGFRLAPGNDVRSQLNRLADDVDLTDVEPFSLGETGAHERCGVGRVDDTSTVVCAWADHGSLATVLLTRRSIDDSAALVAELRSAVLTPLR